MEVCLSIEIISTHLKNVLKIAESDRSQQMIPIFGKIKHLYWIPLDCAGVLNEVSREANGTKHKRCN